MRPPGPAVRRQADRSAPQPPTRARQLPASGGTRPRRGDDACLAPVAPAARTRSAKAGSLELAGARAQRRRAAPRRPPPESTASRASPAPGIEPAARPRLAPRRGAAAEPRRSRPHPARARRTAAGSARARRRAHRLPRSSSSAAATAARRIASRSPREAMLLRSLRPRRRRAAQRQREPHQADGLVRRCRRPVRRCR